MFFNMGNQLYMVGVLLDTAEVLLDTVEVRPHNVGTLAIRQVLLGDKHLPVK